MKKLIYILSFFSLWTFTKAQTEKDKTEITAVVNQIIDGFQTKNADKVNAFVNKDLGIGVIYKTEDRYAYLNLEDMDFSNPFPLQNNYWDIPKMEPIQFERTPGFNPKTKLWSSYGTFCQIDSPMVLFYLDELAEQGSDLSDQEIFKVNEDTSNTAYVVLADKKSNGLQLVLTKINDQWTLTFFDLLNLKSTK